MESWNIHKGYVGLMCSVRQVPSDRPSFSVLTVVSTKLTYVNVFYSYTGLLERFIRHKQEVKAWFHMKHAPAVPCVAHFSWYFNMHYASMPEFQVTNVQTLANDFWLSYLSDFGYTYKKCVKVMYGAANFPSGGGNSSTSRTTGWSAASGKGFRIGNRELFIMSEKFIK